MYKELSTALLLFVFIWNVKAQEQSGSLDDLINQVFNTKNQTSDRNPLNPVTVPSSGGSTDSCTCVAYYLCNNGTINKDGTGIIDIR